MLAFCLRLTGREWMRFWCIEKRKHLRELYSAKRHDEGHYYYYYYYKYDSTNSREKWSFWWSVDGVRSLVCSGHYQIWCENEDELIEVGETVPRGKKANAQEQLVGGFSVNRENF